MRSVLMMIKKNIVKKYLQSTLIGLIIMVSSVIFSASLGIMANTKEPFKSMFDKLNASHDLITMDNKIYDVKTIENWWKSQRDVNGVQLFRLFYYKGKAILKNKTADPEIKITERHSEEVVQDKLLIIEGSKKANPEEKEIWIPTGFAYQNDIRIGDLIRFSIDERDIELKVSAIVVDPQYSSTALDPIRIWIGPGELKNIINDESRVSYDLGIRYNNYSNAPKLWKSFEDFLGKPFIGSKIEYSFTEFVYTVQYNILSSVLLVLSIIIMVVAIFIIGYTITNAILSDYKTIGVLKSQGFSNSQVICIYSGQFSVISFITVPIGILISYFLINQIMLSLLKATGTANLNSSMAIPFLVTFIAINTIVIATSWFTASKAGKIRPAEAIRYGAPPKNYARQTGISILRLKAFSTSLILGIKQLFSYKRQSLFLTFSLIITVFIITFAVNINNSLERLGGNLAYWGFDNSQLTITRSVEKGGLSNSQLISELKGDKRVAVVVPWYYVPQNTVINDQEGTSQRIVAPIYDGDMDSIGIMNIEGRNPVEDNEIAIGINTSRKNNKKVGDYIDIWVKGKKKTFLITGVYQALNNGAEGYRARKEAIIDSVPDFDTIQYAVNLKRGENVKVFIDDMKTKYGNKIDIKETRESLGNLFDGIGENLAVPLKFISMTFIFVTFITMFNTILINIYEEQKSYGIFRTFGITSGQIRISILYRIGLLVVISLLIGVPLGLIISPKMVGMILSGMGMLKFPFLVTVKGTSITLIICIVAVLAGTWLPSGRIKNINPRNLIEE